MNTDMCGKCSTCLGGHMKDKEEMNIEWYMKTVHKEPE